MSSSPYPEDLESADELLTLKDPATGRAIDCYIEHEAEVDGTKYVLLLPEDSTITVFAWTEDEEEEPRIVEDEAEIEQIFADAKAVLSEQNLTLKQTAYTLTVAGELPPLDDEEINQQDEDSDFQGEEYQFLASFYHEEQEYGIYTPLDPILFFARLDKKGEPHLLSPEESEKLQPLLEEWLFDADELE